MSRFGDITIKDPSNGLTANVKNNDNTTNNELLVNLEGHECTDNTTQIQLTAGEVFVGADWQDTLDYGVLSINVQTDIDSAVDGLEVQWSNDGITEMEYDKFTILANYPKTFTFGPAERYYRIKYTNGTDGTTTNFHLTSLLRRVYVKPSSHRITDAIVADDDAELMKSVLSGLGPGGAFLNIEASGGGALKTAIEDEQTSRRVEIEPLGSMKTITPVRLVGTSFNNGTKDINFWTEAITTTGSVTQAGQITIATGTTALGGAEYNSVRRGRKVTGTTNQFRTVARLITDPQADNIRRIGCYDDDNGFFFQINGTTFGIGSRKSTVDSIITNGSFNGNAGATVTIDTNLKRFVIDYTSVSAKFFIDSVLVHTLTSNADALTNTLDLPIRMENYNTGANTTDNSFQVRFATIMRLGTLDTNPIYKYISGASTTVLKRGAGDLHTIVNNDNTGSCIVYDGTSAAGAIIASIDLVKVLGTMTFNAPFSNGLTIVTVGAAKITVVYE